MATLYEVTEQYQELFGLLQQAESDEEADAIMAQIDAVSVGIAEKADAYARVMLNLEADAKAYKAEKLRLAEKQRAAEAAIERMKNRMLDTLTALNVKDIKTSVGKWAAQKNPPKVVVTDVDAIPAQWMIPQPAKVDLTGMLNYIKQTGEVIPGAEVVQETGIRFR